MDGVLCAIVRRDDDKPKTWRPLQHETFAEFRNRVNVDVDEWVAKYPVYHTLDVKFVMDT